MTIARDEAGREFCALCNVIQSESLTLRVIRVLEFLGSNDSIRINALRISAENHALETSRGNDRSRNRLPQTAIHKHTGQSSPEQSCSASITINMLLHKTTRHNPNVMINAIMFLVFDFNIMYGLYHKNTPCHFRQGAFSLTP